LERNDPVMANIGHHLPVDLSEHVRQVADPYRTRAREGLVTTWETLALAFHPEGTDLIE
jgi:hypothetical protein